MPPIKIEKIKLYKYVNLLDKFYKLYNFTQPNRHFKITTQQFNTPQKITKKIQPNLQKKLTASLKKNNLHILITFFNFNEPGKKKTKLTSFNGGGCRPQRERSKEERELDEEPKFLEMKKVR